MPKTETADTWKTRALLAEKRLLDLKEKNRTMTNQSRTLLRQKIEAGDATAILEKQRDQHRRRMAKYRARLKKAKTK